MSDYNAELYQEMVEEPENEYDKDIQFEMAEYMLCDYIS